MALEDPVIAPVREAAVAEDAVEEVQAAPAVAASGIPPRFACFVTGTDTEIGKTLISSAMLHALVSQGVKGARSHRISVSWQVAAGQSLDRQQTKVQCAKRK